MTPDGEIAHWILYLVRGYPGIEAAKISEILGCEVSPEIRELHTRGRIETKDGRIWTDCDCWERV